MKIVIDVGCARYGGDYSVERLIEMYEPDLLYGFDPQAAGDMLHLNLGKLDPMTFELLPPEGPSVHIRTEAAWTFDGEVRFLPDGLNGQVGNADHWPLVPCIDLASFVEGLPPGEIILKLDAEGSEYELLPHLIERDVDERLALVLVEWHPRPEYDHVTRRTEIERALTCPVEEWRW